jgi:Mg2+-importing ATPase
VSRYQRLDEVPYDFIRKRLSVLISGENAHLIVTEGALLQVLSACSSAETPGGQQVDIAAVRQQIQSRFVAMQVFYQGAIWEGCITCFLQVRYA